MTIKFKPSEIKALDSLWAAVSNFGEIWDSSYKLNDLVKQEKQGSKYSGNSSGWPLAMCRFFVARSIVEGIEIANNGGMVKLTSLRIRPALVMGRVMGADWCERATASQASYSCLSSLSRIRDAFAAAESAYDTAHNREMNKAQSELADAVKVYKESLA